MVKALHNMVDIEDLIVAQEKLDIYHLWNRSVQIAKVKDIFPKVIQGTILIGDGTGSMNST